MKIYLNYFIFTFLFGLIFYNNSQKPNSCNKYMINENNNCKINVDLINSNYSIKFSLYFMNKSLVQPIQIKDNNSIYFISTFNLINFNINDYTYFYNNKTQSLYGSIFALKSNNTSKIINENNILVYNSKEYWNIGKEISDIYIMPKYISEIEVIKNTINKGIILIYKNGDICNNKGTRFRTYIFLYCKSKDNINYENKFLYYDISSCSYYFEMYSESACPICLKSETNIIQEGCIKGNRKIRYKPKGACLIINDLKNIAIETELISLTENQYIKKYLENKYETENLTIEKTNNIKDSIISSEIQIEKCNTYLDQILHPEQKTLKLIAILIGGVIYFLFIVLVIILFIKYKKTHKTYEQLKNESTINNVINKETIENGRISLKLSSPKMNSLNSIK